MHICGGSIWGAAQHGLPEHVEDKLLQLYSVRFFWGDNHTTVVYKGQLLSRNVVLMTSLIARTSA